MEYRKINGFYIRKDEVTLIKYILPEYYIDSNLNGVDDAFLLRFMQNELNEITNSFLNGGFSNTGYVFYPLVKSVSGENIKKIERLRKVASFLHKKGYDFSSCVNGKVSNSKNFAVFLSRLHWSLFNTKFMGEKLLKKPKCLGFDVNDYSKKDKIFLKPVEDLKKYAEKRLKGYLLGFYLHGSIATKDYIRGWSDLDTVSIVSKKSLQNPEEILKLRDMLYLSRKFYCRIDPLQHHGSIIITEYDMENYCQAYFPVEIFRHSKSFFSDDKPMSFKARDFSYEALKKMFWSVNYFRKLKYKKPRRLSNYDTKNLLHAITLFPTLYLQAKGLSMYKKFSFSRAKKDFSNDAWKAIDYVEGIRNNWKGTRKMPFAKPFSNVNPVLIYQTSSLITNIYDRIEGKNNINVKNLIDKMFIFSEQAWSKIKKNAKKQL